MPKRSFPIIRLLTILLLTDCAVLGDGRKLIEVTPGVKWLEGTVAFDLNEGGSFIPSAMQLDDGTLVVQFSAIDDRWIRGRRSGRRTRLITFSRDGGQTWAKPTKVPYIGGYDWWASFGKGDKFYAFADPTHSGDGKLLKKGLYLISGQITAGAITWNPALLIQPASPALHGSFGATRTDDGTFFCLYAVLTNAGQELRLRRSTDLGKTWGREILVDPDGADYKEILSLPGGKLVAMWTGGMRPGQAYPNMRGGMQIRVSEDGGDTWGERHTVEPFSPPFYREETSTWSVDLRLRLGPGPKMVQATTTPDGAILALGRWSNFGSENFPPVARVIAAKSYDAGFTWTDHTILHEIRGDIANSINLLGSKRGIRTSTESGHNHTYGSSCTLSDGVLVAYTAPDYDSDRKRAHLVKLPSYPGQSHKLSGATWSNQDLGLFPFELLAKFEPLPEGTIWSLSGKGATDGSIETQYLLTAEYALRVQMKHPRVRCHILRHQGRSVAVVWSDEDKGILHLADTDGLTIRRIDNQVLAPSEGRLELKLRPVFIFASFEVKKLADLLSGSTISDLTPRESQEELSARRGMLVQFNLANQSFFFEEEGSIPHRGAALDHFESSRPSFSGDTVILDGRQAIKLKAPSVPDSEDPSGFHTSPMIYLQQFTASVWVQPHEGSGERAAISQHFQFEIGVGKDNRPFGFLNLISDLEFWKLIWSRLDFGPQHLPVQTQIINRMRTGAPHMMGKPYRVEAKVPLTDRAWTHLALIYDGKELRIFVNGTLSGSSAAVDLMIPRLLRQGEVPDLWVGRSAFTEKGRWKGALADLRLFDHALDTKQLQQLMSVSKP